MSRPNNISVLKFGSSVLRSRHELPRAVEEIYRQRRAGHKVVAVVSALGDTTDILIRKAEALSSVPDERALALLLSTGEARTAAYLTMTCLESGVAALPLLAHEFGLLAKGSRTDAQPVGVDTAPIISAFDNHDVVIVPGFVAADADGHTVLLGRGGSDLTAVILAQALGASCCRLLKDTEGVYESDPALPGPRPRLFRRLSYEDAENIRGDVLQQKAVRFARKTRQTFEVSRSGSIHGTLVGSDSSALVNTDTCRPLTVALLGCGHVGSAVYRRLASDFRFQVSGVAVRNACRPRPGVPSDILTEDGAALAASGADIVVELTGDASFAGPALESAFATGSHVVTANKKLIADRGPELTAAAARNHRTLLFSAAVGGAVPVVETLRASGRRVRTLEGILNGTTNFILEHLEAGVELDEALKKARCAGLCEQNADSDLDGTDAGRKLAVLANECDLQPDSIEQLGAVNRTTSAQCRQAAKTGFVLRQVARLDQQNDRVRASVGLELVPETSFLGGAHGADNRILITWDDGSVEHLRGLGAGPRPTAESVVGDLLAIGRSQQNLSINTDLEAIR